MAPFKFVRRGPGAQAPALRAARCARGVHCLLSASPGGTGGAPPSPRPLLAQPIGGGSRPHVRGARPGSRQNVNEKEERDLKVLVAPAEDKCASFARSPAARRRRPTASQTDGRADGCEPGPRAAEATRAGSDGQTAGGSSREPRGARAPAPLRGARPHLRTARTRSRQACSGPRTEGYLLSGSRSAPARCTKLCSRRPAGFPVAARRGDFSPLAGLPRARL